MDTGKFTGLLIDVLVVMSMIAIFVAICVAFYMVVVAAV